MTTPADIDLRPRKPVNKMIALAEEYRAVRVQAASDAMRSVEHPVTTEDLVKVGDDLMAAVLNAHQGLALFKQTRTFPIEVWQARQDAGFRDAEKQHLRKMLAFDVMEKGYLPVEALQYRVIYFESRYALGGLENTEGWREVPEQYADTVQYEYSCLARKADETG